MLNSLTDPAGNHRIVHGIQVNSIGIVCQQINDLAYAYDIPASNKAALLSSNL